MGVVRPSNIYPTFANECQPVHAVIRRILPCQQVISGSPILTPASEQLSEGREAEEGSSCDSAAGGLSLNCYHRIPALSSAVVACAFPAVQGA